jgi:hypothetical protein
MALNLRALFGLDTKPFDKAAKKSARTAKTSFKDVAKAAAGIFAVGKVIAFSREVRTWSRRMIDLADAAGTSVKTVQQLDIASRQVGTTFEKMSLSARTFTRALVDPRMQDSLKALRIDPEQFKGLSELDQFAKVIGKLSGQNFSGSRLTEFRKIFGDDAATLRQVFKQGIDTNVPLLDRGTLERAKEFDSAVQNLTDRLKAFFAVITAPFLDLFTSGLDEGNQGLDRMSGGIGKLRATTEKWFDIFRTGFSTLFNSWRAISERMGRDFASLTEAAKGIGRALKGDFAGARSHFNNALEIDRQTAAGPGIVDRFSQLELQSKSKRDSDRNRRAIEFAKANRENVSPASFEQFKKTPTKKAKGSQAFGGDSLRDVGGFIGVGPIASPMISKLEKSNLLLAQIAKNTDPKLSANANQPNRDASLFK